MGKIIKAGVEHYFSGGIGSGSDIVILTQEEYDELVTNNTVESGVYYFIEDVNIEGGNNVVNDASDIIYDNSTSGLEADNVQGAVDEINGGIIELNQKYEDIKASFQDGVDTVVSAVNTKTGSSLTRENTPDEIAEVIENIDTDTKHSVYASFSIAVSQPDHDYRNCTLTIYKDGVAVKSTTEKIYYSSMYTARTISTGNVSI